MTDSNSVIGDNNVVPSKLIPSGFTSVTEGQATILFPNDNGVFYNPVQQFNRDLSIAAIRCWAEKRRTEKSFNQSSKFKVCEALSASGLRSIRYAKELGGYLKSIVANDMSADAVESIRRNCEFNDISEGLIVPNMDDACDLMYRHRLSRSRFDVVDIDPYGSAAPFIDAAVQSVADGGLLLVTCTDMAVLAGQRHETCFYKYGGVPLKSDFCHEMALRILLNALHSAAARYQRQIIPLVSLSIDFYVRVFVRVETSASSVKKLASQTSLVYQCSACRSFMTGTLGTATPLENGTVKHGWSRPISGPTCQFCGGVVHIGGPIWSGPLHSPEFLQSMLTHLNTTASQSLYKTHQRMLGMLTVASEELQTPLFYIPCKLGQIMHTHAPPLLKFNSALLNAGYQVSSTHCAHGAVKTTAPTSVVWALMQQWALESEAKADFPVNSTVYKLRSLPKLMAGDEQLKIDFTIHPDSNPPSRRIKLVRFADHKGMNWGPKARAKRRRDSGENQKDDNVGNEIEDGNRISEK